MSCHVPMCGESGLCDDCRRRNGMPLNGGRDLWPTQAPTGESRRGGQLVRHAAFAVFGDGNFTMHWSGGPVIRVRAGTSLKELTELSERTGCKDIRIRPHGDSGWLTLDVNID